MATLTLTIPNPIAARVQTAICTKYGYQATIDGLPNPQTQADFVKEWLIKQLKAAVKEHESNTAASAASIAAGLDVDTNITIT